MFSAAADNLVHLTPSQLSARATAHRLENIGVPHTCTHTHTLTVFGEVNLLQAH